MATTNLEKVHVFPSKDSYNTNKASVGANDLALVPIGTATTSEYGLTRLASESDVLGENGEAVVNVPLAYELNDFRRMNTAYSVGDKVNCAFRFEWFLECIQEGTTSNETLDTRNVTFGQEITDGSVKWVVRAHVKSVNNAVPDANGNINVDTQVNADWNATSGKAQILNKPNLHAVATTGDYNSLYNRPYIPASPNAYVTEAWSDGLKWYRVWSNGFKEQGGIFWQTSKLQDVWMPISFSNTNYCIFITREEPNCTGDYVPVVISGTVTVNKFQCGSNHSRNTRWFTCGY